MTTINGMGNFSLSLNSTAPVTALIAQIPLTGIRQNIIIPKKAPISIPGMLSDIFQPAIPPSTMQKTPPSKYGARYNRKAVITPITAKAVTTLPQDIYASKSLHITIVIMPNTIVEEIILNAINPKKRSTTAISRIASSP
ncbi:MAG: hypothetical protein LKF52_07830 [Butyrivibrio sp.]|nr:hypothetical protein [Butyrivibrio sp.]